MTNNKMKMVFGGLTMLFGGVIAISTVICQRRVVKENEKTQEQIRENQAKYLESLKERSEKMTENAFKKLLTGQAMLKAKQLQGWYGRELTEDDKLECLTEAMNSMRKSGAEEIFDENTLRSINEDIAREWIGIKD